MDYQKFYFDNQQDIYEYILLQFLDNFMIFLKYMVVVIYFLILHLNH